MYKPIYHDRQHCSPNRYYSEVCGLENIIICDLQILFECIADLISAICFRKALTREQEQLRVFGQCSDKLLHRLLDKASEHGLSMDITITLLEHLHLITQSNSVAENPIPARASASGATMRKEYFVPCVLRMFPVETITATVRATPAPLLCTFEHGYPPLGLFTRLLVWLASVRAEAWKLRKTFLFRNMASFHVGEDFDEVTLIARPTHYEVTFSSNSTDRLMPLHEACNAIRLTIDEAIQRVKSGINSTIRIGHSFTFYCSWSQCLQKTLHAAIRHRTKLECPLFERIDEQSFSHQVWFGKLSV